MKGFLRCVLVALSLTVAAQPAPQRTRTYIDHAWKTLTRSMDDCASLADSKIVGHPVLYLPANLAVPPKVALLKQQCGIDVRRLPRPIRHLAGLSPTVLDAQGLLYLPHPYIVPGGFFNEMYGWDSYFIVLGLIADHRPAMARGIVDNFLFEVQHYGGVLNANRTYYLTRSQPPFLGAMIRAVLDDPASFDSRAKAQAWLQHVYPLAVRDHDIWLSEAHRAGDTGLARYFDLGGARPVQEIPDDDYLLTAINWLVAHPSIHAGYLVKASEHPNAVEAAHLAAVSCDVRTSHVCASAWAKGYRLSADFYLGDRAMRESGFDTSFHFGPFGGSTHHYAPVGLNSLLYRYERDLHDFAVRLGRPRDAAHWATAAEARHRAIDTYLWRDDLGMYMDYNYTTKTSSNYAYLTTFYPLWAGVASSTQARAVRAMLPIFEHMGGLAMSDRVSGAQWDAPFGWAPTNWLAVAGLDAYGFHDDARRIAGEFTATVDRSLAADGTIREKYNMISGNADVKISAGYKDNVIGFGWTNGVYLKLRQLLNRESSAGQKRVDESVH